MQRVYAGKKTHKPKTYRDKIEEEGRIKLPLGYVVQGRLLLDTLEERLERQTLKDER
jgi:hypothetical protein